MSDSPRTDALVEEFRGKPPRALAIAAIDFARALEIAATAVILRFEKYDAPPFGELTQLCAVLQKDNAL